MKQVTLSFWHPHPVASRWWLVRPVKYETHNGVCQGYLVDAETEDEARQIGAEMYGELESCAEAD